MRRHHLPLLIALLCLPALASAGWLDQLKEGAGKLLDKPNTTQSISSAGLSDAEVVKGLKAALDKGVGYAVDRLGRHNGFLDNPKVRIPMPKKLAWVDSTLRSLGQGRLADQFVATMNHAAEQAVPATLEVFKQALSKMTLKDARAILDGPNDAATQYFRRTSGAALAARIRPIVAAATNKAGVTHAYKAMIGKADFMGGLVQREAPNLDTYVTQQTLDGIFKMVAEEEQRIRKDPVARTTDLLKKVFAGQ